MLRAATPRAASARLCASHLSRSRLSSSLSIPGTPRSLGDITKLELLQDEEPDRVKAIWEAYHTDRQSVAGASVDAAEYEAVAKRAVESPMFVFPVRRDGGHFMLFSQFSAANRLFALTSLEDYQTNPQMAQPWGSVHLFDEMLGDKGVGLVRAEVAKERLTTDEATHLLLLVRRYYGTEAYDKPWTFNHANRHFDVDKYLEECP